MAKEKVNEVKKGQTRGDYFRTSHSSCKQHSDLKQQLLLVIKVCWCCLKFLVFINKDMKHT